jgi:MYXO-CTERM domain-containing protein
VAFSQAITGLSPGVTYYYCAIAQNAEGLGFGQVLSFTTAAAPDVTTEAATDVGSSAATLNGTAHPNQLASTAYFRYDAADPGTCNDTFGTRAPASGGTTVAALAGSTAFSEAITGLAPGRTYYFCAIAQNAAGTSFGLVLSFTTAPDAPDVVTNPATSVEPTSAQLNGAANPNGDAATGHFRLDTVHPGACNDTFGTRFPATGGTALGGGVAQVAFSEQAASLVPGTRYYFCAIASNSVGTGHGEVLTFVAGANPPVVTTEPATSVAASSASMEGTANPSGTQTTAWFRLGDSDPGTCSDSFGARVPGTLGLAVGDGFAPVAFSMPIEDLEPAMTYYYCAAASNSAGAAFGQVLSFTTAATPPEVDTVWADVQDGSVTMTGQGNPLGSETTAWFRYDTVAPGACNDSFGARMPTSGGQSLGSGREAVQFDEIMANVPPGTYYFCAIASNEAGTGYGEIMTFFVPTPQVDPPGKKGGCDCRASSGEGGALGALLVVLFLLLVGRRRRRRPAP